MSGSLWSGNGKPAIRDVVYGLAVKVLPKTMAKKHFPGTHMTARIEGVLTNNTDARKLAVDWKLPDGSVLTGSHAQRILFGTEQVAQPFLEGVGPDLANVDQVFVGTEAELCPGAGDVLVDVDPDDVGEDLETPEELSPQDDPAASEVGNDTRNPHGQKWEVLEGGVTIDKRTEVHWRPRLLWPVERGSLRGQTRLATFLLMMPNILDVAVNTFNTTKPLHVRVLTMGELLMFIGLSYAQGIVNVRVRRDNWATPDSREKWRIFPSPDFGKWGMTARRYEQIMAHLKWYPTDDDRFPASDPWKCMRYFVFMFNERRGHPQFRSFQAGWRLCVDESTIKWRGADGEATPRRSRRRGMAMLSTPMHGLIPTRRASRTSSSFPLSAQRFRRSLRCALGRSTTP